MSEEIFNSRSEENKFFIVLLIGLSVFVLISFVLGARVERGDVSAPSRTVENAFPEVTLQAKSAYVYDLRTRSVLLAKNENTRLPLASLTKVMAALVAQDKSPEYGTVTISREALRTEGDSGLSVNERWSLKDLLDFSLITSSNDGIRAVALSLGALETTLATEEEMVADFVREMNKKASELDLKNTYFWNETGLDESEVKGGAYGTAKDINALLEYIILHHPLILESTREATTTILSLDEKAHTARNTNIIASEIPGLLASKTGFTDTAGGNLVLVFDPELGRPIIVTILGSTQEGRFEDAKILIDATLKYISQ